MESPHAYFQMYICTSILLDAEFLLCLNFSLRNFCYCPRGYWDFTLTFTPHFLFFWFFFRSCRLCQFYLAGRQRATLTCWQGTGGTTLIRLAPVFKLFRKQQFFIFVLFFVFSLEIFCMKPCPLRILLLLKNWW